MEFINLYDFLLVPVYIVLLYLLVSFRSKKYGPDPLRKYFIAGFFLHMVGSILYCLIIIFYYGYGDSLTFFQGSEFLRKVISATGDPITPFTMNAEDFQRLVQTTNGLESPIPTGLDVSSNLTVVRISTVLSYIGFDSYFVVSLFFGLFSFLGIWKFYKVANEITEKKAQWPLAMVLLYLPSICFWGSGLIKDSLCLGAIGFIVYYIYKMAVKKQFKIKDFVLFVLCCYLLFVVKSYLGIGLFVAMMLGYVIHILILSKRNLLRLIVVLCMVAIAFTVVIITFSSTIDSIIQNSRDNIEVFKGAYAYGSEEQFAGFNTVNVDISLSGIILQSPLAVFTTLFRPFLWESSSLVMLFSALESFLTLCFTIYILARCRVWKFFYYIFTDAYLFASFIFVMLMGIIIGLSTFNFGTLVRYRLPVLPFYFFILICIFLKIRQAKSET